MSSKNRFKYKPLDLGKRSAIRVLSVLPERTSDGLLQFKLRHTTTSDPYICLSYVWGDTHRKRYPVSINGHIFLVLHNLYIFLHSWSARKDAEISGYDMWIDAICIDQGNIAEQNHQVQQMGDIYSNASRVLTWLGHDASINRAVALLRIFRWFEFNLQTYPSENHNVETTIWDRNNRARKLRVWSYECWKYGISLRMELPKDKIVWLMFNAVHEYRSLITANSQRGFEAFLAEMPKPSVCLQSLKEFCTVLAKYWSRAWVTQEVGLANCLSIWGSAIGLDATYFKAGLDDIKDLIPGVHSHLSGLEIRSQQKHQLTAALDFWNFIGSGRSLPFYNNAPERLMDLLERYQSKQCYKPRDRIYSLLSLCGPGLDLSVDYSLTEQAVFGQLTEVMQHQTDMCFAQKVKLLRSLDFFGLPPNEICLELRTPFAKMHKPYVYGFPDLFVLDRCTDDGYLVLRFGSRPSADSAVEIFKAECWFVEYEETYDRALTRESIQAIVQVTDRTCLSLHFSCSDLRSLCPELMSFS